MRRVLYFIAMLVLATPAYAAGSFADWGAIVVAGDWRAHDGSPSEIFDNARRDVSADLVRMGFNPANVLQFSVHPANYHGNILQSDAQTIANSLWDLSNRTSAGCLLYLSSHGEPDGMILNDTVLEPAKLAEMVDNACGDRPTVVIVSACFSGAFVPALRGPNRMVLTAARPDRTSFGCGADNKYPYFDTCFLSELPLSHDLPGLADLTRACVSATEKKTGMKPPSEPQLSIGAEIAQQLPGW